MAAGGTINGAGEGVNHIINNNNNNNNLIIIITGVILLLMLLLIFVVIILFLYKPWRFFFSSNNRSLTIKSPLLQTDDIERPLISDDLNISQQIDEFAATHAFQGKYHSTEGHLSSPKTHGDSYIQQLPPLAPKLTHSDSFVLNIIDQLEDASLGQTLKRPIVTPHFTEENKVNQEELIGGVRSDNASITKFIPKGNVGSSLLLEVTNGPSRGLRHSLLSKMASKLPLTLGRVAPSDLLLKDSEVSGKHALINWNSNKLKWEVVDMGSLNGTFLNSRSICHPDTESRHWGDPTELVDGDIITLGTSTKIAVQIKSQTELLIPFGVGVVSDPMALRRGGKKLPMEDVCYYRWPLPGTDQFGVFGICDGHGGVAAATSASKALPEAVASILSDPFLRERVLSRCDATDVLRDAFIQTEASMNHYYEGCTATVLLVWADDHDNFFAQCANVGDSSCVMNVNGKQIKMSEDHRITSYSERLRIQEVGEPLKDGETRLCGLNLGRMLGDKFLKQQDNRFSSEPYVSRAVPIHYTSGDFALLASDGFWDVVNLKKAFQLVQQGRERYVRDAENLAEKMANFLLNEARTQRTKDNTSIIFLDFDRINRNSSCRF